MQLERRIVLNESPTYSTLSTTTIWTLRLNISTLGGKTRRKS